MVKLCCGKVDAIWKDAGRWTDRNLGYVWIYGYPTPTGVKRIRFKCPVCGRRVMSSIKMYHDGDYIIHTLPPHKPKGWWKKNGKNRKKGDDSQIYRSAKRRF